MPRTSLQIDGMHCASCVARVEKALRRAEGVEDASVNLTTGRADVDGRGLVVADLITAVHLAGYEASQITPDKPVGAGGGTEGVEGKHIFFSRGSALPRAMAMLPLAAAVMALNMFVDTSWSPWLQFALCSTVVVVLGTPFYLSAAKGLRYRRVDMDALIALGSGVAYVVSVLHLLTSLALGGALHFGTAAAILWFITLGHALEHKARKSAASAIDRLRKLAPETATVIRLTGEEEMPIQDIPEGAIVLIKPGGRVPLDGEIKKGNATIDQSMVTGESMPVEVGAGDRVYAGTINRSGSLRITVTATGAQTLLGQIVTMVEQAQTSKAGIQRLADKLAGVFVPAVIVIAISALLGWGLAGGDWARGVVAAVAVLIVACPCALGLAVPMAILVATGVGARRGILIKDPAALERSYGLSHALLDKTGTLTTGRPALTGVWSASDGWTTEQLLRLAAAAEQDSEHPMGRALVDDAQQQGLDLPPATYFASHTSAGITASVEGKIIKVGRASALRDQGVVLPDGLEDERERKLPGARTVIVVAVDNQAVGLIGLADEIRPGAADAVAALHKVGLRTVMATGDSQFAADHVARELGIERTFAEVKPADKRQLVLELQTGGRSVLMVGDGVNDAPALAEADLGVAMSGGTDIAHDAGHVVILGDDLSKIVTAVRLGKATTRRITAGLLWASIYNLCLIPLAATGIMDPMFAALAMSLSSVSVVVNALWLRWAWKE